MKHDCEGCPLSAAPTRRSLLGWLSAGVITLAWLPHAWAKKIAIPLSKVPKLQEVGGSMVLKLKGKKLLFIRESETTVHVFSAVCSHKKTIVGYNPKKKRIDCPEHESKFNLKDGRPDKGPAKKPLPKYQATYDAAKERIVVDLG